MVSNFESLMKHLNVDPEVEEQDYIWNPHMEHELEYEICWHLPFYEVQLESDPRRYRL